MDYIINSFYILYKRWIPAGDPKDEAVVVTSILIWLNVMSMTHLILYKFFKIAEPFRWQFIVTLAVIYLIMYNTYTRKKRIDTVIEKNPLFGGSLQLSMIVIAASIISTVWMFLKVIVHVVNDSLGI
jgi:hypothetical protein